MELRKDYILDRYTIIASERAKRPQQFKQEIQEKNNDNCFFCPGNESKTPDEITRKENKKGWYMRVFPNKYPAVSNGNRISTETHNSFFTFADAVGHHEIVVETAAHDKEIWDLNEKRLLEVIKIYKERILELKKDKTTKYVSVFKNQGREAGASIQHSHSQIISYNIIPPLITKKEKACQNYNDCPYCKIIKAEENSPREVFKDSNAICFTPYAPRFLFEAWILPRRHVIGIEELNEEELKSINKALLIILKKLKKLNAPFNYHIHYGIKNMHFHIEITPRLSKWAGFEFATETYINPISPEQSADYYKKR